MNKRSKQELYKLNAEEARRHLGHLCRFCGENDWLEIRILGKGVLIKWFKSPDDAVNWLADNWAKRRLYERFVYTGLLPRESSEPPTTAGKSEMVKKGAVLFADLDYKRETQECGGGLREGEDHALTGTVRIGDKCVQVDRPPLREVVEKHKELLGTEPSLVIDSGYGYHVYLFLDKPLPVTEWRRLEDKYTGILGADRAKDPARVVGLAGTLNVKGTEPRPVRILYESGAVAKADELLARLVQEGPVEVEAITAKPQPISQESIEKIVDILKQYWVPGHRDALELGLVGWMIKRGVPLEQAREVVERIARAAGDEELEKRVAEVERQYKAVQEGRKKLEELIGKTGLVSELEAVIQQQNPGISPEEARDRALLVVQELEKILGPRTSLLIITPYSTGVYFVNDPKRGIVLARKLASDGETKIKRQYISDWYVRKAAVVRAEGVYLYKVLLRNVRTGETVTIGGQLDEIAREIRRLHGVKRGQLVQDAVSAIISEFIRRGLARVRRAAAVAGIVPVKNGVKLVRTGALSKLSIPREPEAEKAKRALELLTDLRKSYDQVKFDTAINWAAYAPISYALKKLYHVKQVYLLLHGEKQTGKTTLARILLGLYPVVSSSEEEIPEEGQSEYRLAWKMNITTLPVLEDEVQGISKKPGLLGLIKRAATGINVRWRGDQGRMYKARAPIVFTSNYTELIDDPALVERIIQVEFTRDDYVYKKPRDEIIEFKRKYLDYLGVAPHLGAVLLSTLVNKWDEIVRDWVYKLVEKQGVIELGKWVWKKVAEALGAPTPPWAEEGRLLLEDNEPEAVMEEVFWETIEEAIREAAIRAKVFSESIIDTLRELENLRALPPWLRIKDGYLVVLYGIIPEMKKKGIEPSSMRQLAKKLGFDYKSVRLRPKPAKGILIPLSALEDAATGEQG